MARAALLSALCVGAISLSFAVRTAEAQTGDAARGRALVSAFRDSLPKLSGNGLRCTSCHLDDGTRATAMSWHGTATRYPRYRARKGSEETLAQRVNECVARSLAGRMLPEDSRDMRDMVSYIESLRDSVRPVGVDTVRLVGVVAQGRKVYFASCARCHGSNGSNGPLPAVWGSKSFSIGAGLARQTVFATFVRWNMPFDHKDTLSNQQAADVAAYVLRHARQDHPGKQRDWPKGDPPADVAYATDGARAAGKALPPPRPLLPRRVSPATPSAAPSSPLR